jgi:chromate transporter
MRDSLPTATATTERVSLGTLFWIFLKIGSVTFGGFMALISVIADTIVERRKLLKQEDMLDCISLANLLPGPQGVNCVADVVVTGF